MSAPCKLSKSAWDMILNQLLEEFEMYAPFTFEDNIEYSIVSSDNTDQITYNCPKPSSPLKTFFLPFRENVFMTKGSKKERIILGPPSCDLSGLSILDEIYLDKEYIDPNYAYHREHTLLIGFDCHVVNAHCHCNAYGFSPVPHEHADLVVSLLEDNLLISVISEKGKEFHDNYLKECQPPTDQERKALSEVRAQVIKELESLNHDLPDYTQTGKIVSAADEETWATFSDTCVSCGACSAICPTCSCFLFIERPEFEKVRSLDTCQYPGFERVAAGEDPLRALEVRFRNRYMCKYVWKPQKFNAKACTGCGRCIEACIGEINKNELFRELTKKETESV